LEDLHIGLVSTEIFFPRNTLMTLRSSSFRLGHWYN
jgi:hypothetical protein